MIKSSTQLSNNALFVLKTHAFEISVLVNTEIMTLRKVFWYQLIMPMFKKGNL